MNALERLGAVSRSYELAVNEYGPLAVTAAKAEAAYRVAKAKAVLAAKAGPERTSVAEAEARADADDNIANLLQERLIAAALADAHKAKLAQLREQVATGRTLAASERAVDVIHAQGTSGAA